MDVTRVSVFDCSATLPFRVVVQSIFYLESFWAFRIDFFVLFPFFYFWLFLDEEKFNFVPIALVLSVIGLVARTQKVQERDTSALFPFFLATDVDSDASGQVVGLELVGRNT